MVLFAFVCVDTQVRWCCHYSCSSTVVIEPARRVTDLPTPDRAVWAELPYRIIHHWYAFLLWVGRVATKTLCFARRTHCTSRTNSTSDRPDWI